MACHDPQPVAMTPPMGWNSWDCYAANVTEEQLLANAAYMSRHLRPYGWQYVVCDIQWSEPLAGTENCEYRPFAPLCMDEYSRLIPAPNRFPSSAGGAGFGPIARRVHDMGLKFGIHIMRGIPRQAVHARTSIKGAGVTAERIANPFSICGWNSDMYGVDAGKPGAQAYYNSLFELYASWGVDYVKVDDICNTNLYVDRPYSARAEVEMIHRAERACGRPMVISLSPGPAVIEEAWHLRKHANMWRMTNDFWDDWKALLHMFERCEVWQAWVGPGSWPDCDMLPLGHIGMGWHTPRDTRFTHDEQRTMMTLWCVFRSPLMIGCELNDNDGWTLGLLTNEEVIAVNQHGETPTQLERDGDHAVWVSRAQNEARYVALFNLSEVRRTVRLALDALGMERAAVRDLWQRKELDAVEKALAMEIAPHGAALLRVTPIPGGASKLMEL